MIRVHVICEGPTEEIFVRELLTPHFTPMQIYLYPALLGRPGHKGGRVKYDRLFTDVRNRLKEDTESHCTTFFDFYGLPPDFPGRHDAAQKTVVDEKAQSIKNALAKSIESELGSTVVRRFIPYIQMYEFEALLFSDPAKFARGIDRIILQTELQAIRDLFATPEEINDNPDTAPSKRIKRIVPGYDKPLYGTLVALEIGLDTIRHECRLFDAWIKQLEGLAG